MLMSRAPHVERTAPIELEDVFAEWIVIHPRFITLGGGGGGGTGKGRQIDLTT